MKFRVGDATVQRIYEQHIDVPVAMLSTDSAFVDRHIRTLPPAFCNPATECFELTFQSWLIAVDDLLVVVDPCNGNGRSRPGLPFFDNLTIDWPDRFSASGHSPEDVDIVFCTHLHCDHCGWNTRLHDGRWMPTFPNAAYHFTAREVERWDPGNLSDPNRPADPDYNIHVFRESVAPIIEAGLARIVTPPHRLSESVTIEPAPGHTIGHALLHLHSGDEQAFFSGDVLHHPAEIADPTGIHFGGAEDPEAMARTRLALFDRIAGNGAFLFPAHFGAPHHGRIGRADEGFVFLPGGAETD